MCFKDKLSGLSENTIRDYARSLLIHLFYVQTQKFWRSPNLPYPPWTRNVFALHRQLLNLHTQYLKGVKQ